MLRRVALVRTDASEECSACFIRVTIIGELGTTLAVTSNRRTLRRNTNLARRFNYWFWVRIFGRNIGVPAYKQEISVAIIQQGNSSE
jgi:hypothetical protein